MASWVRPGPMGFGPVIKLAVGTLFGLAREHLGLAPGHTSTSGLGGGL